MDQESTQLRMSAFRKILNHTLDHALKHLDHLEHTPVDATTSLSDLRRRLGRSLADTETDATEVIDELVADSRGECSAPQVVDTLDGSTACATIYAAAPAEMVMEEISGIWLKDLLNLPSEATFALVTGCQMAHFTCIAAARHFLLARIGWDVERDGLNGAPHIYILTSTEHHGSIQRAVRMLGLGSRSIVSLPVDERGRLPPATLTQALAEYANALVVVVLQAGDINTGSYDSFAELIPIARQANAWVHIDGAFGLWAAASSTYSYLLTGAEQADSWATDGHKWLNVPFDCGYAFVAQPDAHLKSMSYRGANYLTYGRDARDSIDWTPDWSRRGRGVATYAVLRQLGRQGVAKLVELCCRHAHVLVTGIGALPGAELVWEPQINQGLVRFLDTRPDATLADHNERTDVVMGAINKTGEAFFTGTNWRGKRCMRVSVSNWQTNSTDVARALAATRRVLQRDEKTV